MYNVTNKIIKRIRAKQYGWVFSPKDFLDLGSRSAVDKALSRFVASGVIRRISRGIYDFPKKHKVVGTLSPSIDGIARAMAVKMGKKICPSGAMAANILGLSTQVPAKSVYVTNGPYKQCVVGAQVIILKRSRVPVLNNVPDVVNLTLQVLSYFGKSRIDNDLIRRCAKRLNDKDIQTLKRNASDVPYWMANAIHKIAQEKHG